MSSLRLHSALGRLLGCKWSGFGRLGRGMSSALVGSGYGWVGRCVGLWGGVFSWCLWLGECGVRVVIVESGEGKVGCWVRERVHWGFWERGAKKLYYLVAPFEIGGFQTGVNFVSKLMLKERSA
jgi:hypothetical protein